MNPTLSARLQARRSEPLFRAHPASPWALALETPVALQALAAARPAAAQLAPVPPPASAAPAAAVPESSPVEPLVLVLMALVWLVDGWLALRQGLRRPARAAEAKAVSGASLTPRPESQPPVGQPAFAAAGCRSAAVGGRRSPAALAA